jgi:hypothetical protein
VERFARGRAVVSLRKRERVEVNGEKEDDEGLFRKKEMSDGHQIFSLIIKIVEG